MIHDEADHPLPYPSGGGVMEHLVNGAKALGFSLSPAQIQAFQRYADELMAWNKRLNLTAITAPEDIQIKHFLDSLTCLLAIPPASSPRRIIDIGTGAGFPGLPLKIYDPTIRLTLLESIHKKTAFLQHLVTVLNLNEVEVIAGRAEALAHDPRHREAYDVAVARAVAELPVLAEYCLPFCRVGGLFIAQKKAGIEEEIKSAEGAITTLGGVLQGVIPVTLPGVDPRQIIVVKKVQPTPPHYPRRVGVPARRPLV